MAELCSRRKSPKKKKKIRINIGEKRWRKKKKKRERREVINNEVLNLVVGWLHKLSWWNCPT